VNGLWDTNATIFAAFEGTANKDSIIVGPDGEFKTAATFAKLKGNVASAGKFTVDVLADTENAAPQIKITGGEFTAGNVTALSGSSPEAAKIIVSGGKATFGNLTKIGNVNGGIEVSGDGELTVGNLATTVIGTIKVSGTGTLNTGTLTSVDAKVDVSGTGVVNFASLLTNGITQAVSISGGTVNILGAADSGTPGSGAYNLTGGTLNFNGAVAGVAAFGAPINVGTGGTVNFNGALGGSYDTPAITLTGGTVNINGASTLKTNGITLTTGTLTLDAAATLTTGDGAVTMAAGTFNINGALTAGSSDVVINGGIVNVGSVGSIKVGTSAGDKFTLTAGTLNLSEGATLAGASSGSQTLSSDFTGAGLVFGPASGTITVDEDGAKAIAVTLDADGVDAGTLSTTAPLIYASKAAWATVTLSDIKDWTGDHDILTDANLDSVSDDLGDLIFEQTAGAEITIEGPALVAGTGIQADFTGYVSANAVNAVSTLGTADTTGTIDGVTTVLGVMTLDISDATFP
jgi:hypothetical protein